MCATARYCLSRTIRVRIRIVLTEKFDRAVQFARIAHQGQVRKGTTVPYLSHLLQVAGLVLEFGGTEEEAIAGLLHDAAEDQGGEDMLSQIEAEFGPAVADIVRANSDSLTEAKEDKAGWKERKLNYIDSVSHKSRSACLVSLADKIHNSRSLLADQRAFGDAHWERFNAGREQALWYYQSLIAAFRSRVSDFPDLTLAATELERTVAELGKGSEGRD